MFGLGMHELLIVGLIAVLLFGRKLPEVARSLGTSYREFKKGMNEFHSQITTDTYSAPTSYKPQRSTYDDYGEEPTAPKFEPPASEPQPESATADAETRSSETA